MVSPAPTGGGSSVGRARERCGGSTAGEVRKDVIKGRASVGPLEGHSSHELRLGGILYPTPVSLLPSLNFERKKYREMGTAEAVPSNPACCRPQIFWALIERVPESFRIGAVRRDASKTPQVCWPRYGAIMTLPTASRLRPSATGSGTRVGCGLAWGDSRSLWHRIPGSI